MYSASPGQSLDFVFHKARLEGDNTGLGLRAVMRSTTHILWVACPQGSSHFWLKMSLIKMENAKQEKYKQEYKMVLIPAFQQKVELCYLLFLESWYVFFNVVDYFNFLMLNQACIQKTNPTCSKYVIFYLCTMDLGLQKCIGFLHLYSKVKLASKFSFLYCSFHVLVLRLCVSLCKRGIICSLTIRQTCQWLIVLCRKILKITLLISFLVTELFRLYLP